MSKRDNFLWIVKIIKSCETIEQIDCSKRIIERYYKRWGSRLDRSLLYKFVYEKIEKLKLY